MFRICLVILVFLQLHGIIQFAHGLGELKQLANLVMTARLLQERMLKGKEEHINQHKDTKEKKR